MAPLLDDDLAEHIQSTLGRWNVEPGMVEWLYDLHIFDEKAFPVILAAMEAFVEDRHVREAVMKRIYRLGSDAK